MTDVPYRTFDDWFLEPEGFGLRAERFDGDVEWLKAAFEAGREAERERFNGWVEVPPRNAVMSKATLWDSHPMLLVCFWLAVSCTVMVGGAYILFS